MSKLPKNLSEAFAIIKNVDIIPFCESERYKFTGSKNLFPYIGYYGENNEFGDNEVGISFENDGTVIFTGVENSKLVSKKLNLF